MSGPGRLVERMASVLPSTGDLVSPDARDLVFRDVSGLAPEEAMWERDPNLRRLERECGSVPRLLVGVGAWLLTELGVAGLTLAAMHGLPVAVRVLGPAVGTAPLALGALLGLRVARAGRAVVDARCSWQLAPERARIPAPALGLDSIGTMLETRVFRCGPCSQ